MSILTVGKIVIVLALVLVVTGTLATIRDVNSLKARAAAIREAVKDIAHCEEEYRELI